MLLVQPLICHLKTGDYVLSLISYIPLLAQPSRTNDFAGRGFCRSAYAVCNSFPAAVCGSPFF